ncbi:DUF368 domain-containing protein [Hahella sp. CCB-MM4]|uniref:DUF368 domain-containing protein n=1 Tax=Hahella sp. (strain CCB-MM4) TaxID=1926491 RepID=UPI000B9BEDBC|nr:DUF368 domain-containing protein [Hahella sp. CCB-MM4]OZG72472.1 DUF368 domain-containing protein [Hahella sp. CCB-MM4]
MWSNYFKGVAMGAADVVPGVSGGTIAFISGIYERLIGALAQISPGLWTVFRKQGVQAVWRQIDGTFLVVLFAGILTSVFTLSKLISYLLVQHAALLWAFFFGLILGSVWFIGRAIKERSIITSFLLVAGAICAYILTSFAPTSMEPTYLNIFISGAIAICAMILPGVSGSFLLLLLGMYSPILTAVKGFDVTVLAIFASGCVIGLVSFTHVLNWLLKRYHDATLAVLTGFMLGALNKVWPWKYTLEYRIDSHGNTQPLVQMNVSPIRYESITGESSQLIAVILLAVLGLAIVLLLEKLRTSYQK